MTRQYEYIELTMDVPVNPKFGLTKGKRIQVEPNPDSVGGHKRWMATIEGEDVFIHAWEAKRV